MKNSDKIYLNKPDTCGQETNNNRNRDKKTNNNQFSEPGCGDSISIFDPGFDNFRKLMRENCNINNFAIDTHKNYKEVWEHAFEQGKMSPIEEHPEYKTLMDKYSIKTKCGYVSAQNIEDHPQFEAQRKKWEKQCLSQPINLHPGYQELMDKYAIRNPISSANKNSCGSSSFIPCKDIKKHPDYENEKKQWFKSWNEQPITRHPQYRTEVEKVLQKLLQQLGREKMCQSGGGTDFDTLVNYYGGAQDLNQTMKATIVDDELKQMYRDIVTGKSNPCVSVPKGNIEDHPQYRRLVDTLTKKIQMDFGYRANENSPVLKCRDAINDTKREVEKEYREKMSCMRRELEAKQIQERGKMEAHINAENEKKTKRLTDLEYELSCCRNAMKQFKSQPITSHPEYTRIKQTEDKMQLKLKDLENKLSCCQKSLEQAKTRPITQHPDYLQLVTNEQKKLLTKIKTEQLKCKQPPVTVSSNQCTPSSSKVVTTETGNGQKTIPQSGGEKKTTLNEDISTIACGDPEIRCEWKINERLCQQKKELLDKYACYDGYNYYKGICGPPKKLEEYDITNHPKIQDYVKKTEVNGKIQLEKYNYPITQHPDYPKVKAYFKQLLDMKLAEIHRQRYPIQNHPDYRKLMDKYACSGPRNTTGYLPCKKTTHTKEKCDELVQVQLVESTPSVVNRDEYEELKNQIRLLQLEATRQAEPPSQTIIVETAPPQIPVQTRCQDRGPHQYEPKCCNMNNYHSNYSANINYDKSNNGKPNYNGFNSDEFPRLALY
jgi:uncharacterized membrane protein YfbV (UPF0208 family)